MYLRSPSQNYQVAPMRREREKHRAQKHMFAFNYRYTKELRFYLWGEGVDINPTLEKREGGGGRGKVVFNAKIEANLFMSALLDV